MVSNTNNSILVSMVSNNYNTLHNEHLQQADAMLKGLEKGLDEWKREVRSKKEGFLTTAQIDFLGVLAEKHLREQQLNQNQRTMKTGIHKQVGYALRDIVLMERLGFIGWSSRFDPLGNFILTPYAMRIEASELDRLTGRAGKPVDGGPLDMRSPRMREKINPPFRMETWKEDLPAIYLERIVRGFVEMFGDEYAIPIAKAIEKGLKTYNDRMELTKNYWTNTGIEVPIIRRKY